MRPFCRACNRNPAAINCYHNGKTYFRSRCNACIRKNKKMPLVVPRWQKSGYKKKSTCDRCGFKARYSAQLLVYHVNGRLTDCDLRNLKTICMNCVEEIKRLDLPWRPGDLEPDH